jgi:hypothetical protein
MNILEKANFVGKVFMGGVKAQLKQEWTWGLAASVGLYQGLKYTGSIKNGISGGAAALIVMAGASGLCNVAENWDGIKRALKED